MVVSGGICACLLIMVICWWVLVIYCVLIVPFGLGCLVYLLVLVFLLLGLGFVRRCDFCRWLG